jgi:heat shock protein HslJ
MKPVLLILCLLLAACQTDETVSGQTTAGDIWVLIRIEDVPVDPRITIQFPEEGRVAGQAPCNSYSGAQTAPLPWIDIGPLAVTRRACPHLDLETTYFQSLDKMAFVETLGDTMLMTAEDGTELEFRRDTKRQP